MPATLVNICLRLFRKHLYRFGHVCVGAEPGFQIEEAAGWITLANITQEAGATWTMNHDRCAA
jgi:hypothetical protein